MQCTSFMTQAIHSAIKRMFALGWVKTLCCLRSSLSNYEWLHMQNLSLYDVRSLLTHGNRQWRSVTLLSAMPRHADWLVKLAILFKAMPQLLAYAHALPMQAHQYTWCIQVCLGLLDLSHPCTLWCQLVTACKHCTSYISGLDLWLNVYECWFNAAM